MIKPQNEIENNTEKPTGSAFLTADVLTDIDDSILADAMENKPQKHHFPWLAAAAAFALLLAAGLLIAHFVNNNIPKQYALAPTAAPQTASGAVGDEIEPTNTPPGNPIPSYSKWESQLPSATSAPNGYRSIDAVADAIQHGDPYLIETIDRIYVPANLPSEAAFNYISVDVNYVIEYTLANSDPEDGESIILLFQKGWGDFDIGSYLRADNRIYEEHDGLFIVTGYNEGDPRIGNMPAAGNLKNVYWTREEGLFLLRVPRSYTVEQIRALTELTCILLPNAYPDFEPYEHFAFESLDEFIEALQTGDHSDDELGTIERYFTLEAPPEGMPIRYVYVDPEIFQLDYFISDDSRLIFNWLRREEPEAIDALIAHEIELFNLELTTRRLENGITVIEGFNNDAIYAFWAEDGCVFSLFVYGRHSDAEVEHLCSIRCASIENGD